MPSSSASRRRSGELSHESLLKTIRSAADSGAESATNHGVNYIIGDLWTARQRQGHSLHEISYRACFKPQLPEFLLNMLTQPGDVVLDPFLGRGTTAIQSALMDRVAYGSDISPLAALLTRPRLSTPAPAAVAERLSQMPAAAAIPAADRELSVFFHRQVLKKLLAMKQWFKERESARKLDNIDRWIRMVATNRLTGHSPGFFSVKTMPPNQAVSVAAQKIINAKHQRAPQPKDVPEIIMKKTASLLRSGGLSGGRQHKLACAPSSRLSYIKDAAVSAVITSPPFLDTVNYHQDNWLRCWFNDIAPSSVKISCCKKPEEWKAFVRRTFAEFARVVKPGGYIAFEVGETRKGEILLERLVIEAVQDLPFSLITVLINSQQFTKTANCWGVQNNAQGTNTNRIAVFKRG